MANPEEVTPLPNLEEGTPSPGDGEMVVCPYLFDELDERLTQPNGSPTLCFRAAKAAVRIHRLAFLAGTCITPGLLDAWEARDPLLALGLGLLAVAFGVIIPRLYYEARSTIRGAAHHNGPLHQLGAGTALIPPDKEKTLRELPMPNPLKDKMVWVAFILFVGPVLYTGWGLQSSPVQNRLTAATFMAFLIGKITKASTVTLRTATALIAARIQAISKAVRLEAKTAGQDVNPEEWEHTVVARAGR